MPKLMELFTTDSAPEQILTDIYRTVTEAVKQKLIGTSLVGFRLGPQDIKGTNLNLVAQTKNSFTVGQPIGEGAEFPIQTEDTFRYNTVIAKYGTRPLVTKEMTEDSLFAVMQRNLANSGFEMARKIDRIILAAARQGAGATTSGGANVTIGNITESMFDLESNDYTPTDYVLGPQVTWDLRNIDTFVEADKSGVNNPSQSFIGRIFGMNVWQSNNIVTSRTATSTNTTDSIVLDKAHALAYAEKVPLSVRQYEDVTRDLLGAVLRIRADAFAIPDTSQTTRTSTESYYTTNAISLITSS